MTESLGAVEAKLTAIAFEERFPGRYNGLVLDNLVRAAAGEIEPCSIHPTEEFMLKELAA